MTNDRTASNMTEVLRFKKFTHIQISFLAFQKEFLKSPSNSEVQKSKTQNFSNMIRTYAFAS
ncbi:hypothetical protein MSIBF_A2380007 [groundwater metagenome]|uniref:Uncharacterized protein n=1 Tax=groundwater metagenome TaxID=717931 RepID=A0A098EAE6_9ZZZZ